VKPHVQVDAASFTNDVGATLVTDTRLTAVALMVAPVVGATALTSEDVATEKLDPPYAPAGPLIMATVNVADAKSPSASRWEHVCPLALDKETTTTLDFDGSEPVPAQVVAKFPLPVGVTSTMDGVVVDVVKPAGKVTVSVLLDVSCPDDDVVKPTVHVDATFATSDVGAGLVNVTVDNDDAPAITLFETVMISAATTAAPIAA
jgi:hypothetical protein